MRKLHYLVFALILGLSVSFTSCSDDDDKPDAPGVELPTAKGTLAALKALATGDKGVGVLIDEEIILEGTVVSNPATMNLNKGLFIQVGDAAIKLSVDESGATFKSLQVGQKVFLKAQGLYIGLSYDVPVIGETSDDKYKVGLISDKKMKAVLTIDTETVKEVTPKVVTIADVKSPLAMVGTVVSIEGVQFIEADKEGTYYSGTGAYATTSLIDAEGNKIAISTYKKATFGGETVKGTNSGTVTAVLSVFSGKPQLILRSENDLAFAAARFEEAKDPDPTTDSKVYFSEYYEGASFDKYIEIYNGTDGDINLANYTVRPAMNGGDWNDPVALEGTLKAGEIFIICHTGANDAIKAKAGMQNEDVCNFNGDDAVGLFVKVGSGWSLCDVIGVPGTKKEWKVGETEKGAIDHTLIRKETITVGNPDWTAATTEWDVKAKGYIASIGIRGEGEVEVPEYNFVDKTVDTLNETFEAIVGNARVSIEGWFTEGVTGTEYFEGKDYSGDKFVQVAGFKSTSADITTWMVTPGLNLDATGSKKNFSFDSKRGYTKAEELKVLVSSDFDYNTGVAAATWTELTVTLPAENGSGFTEYLNSGVVDLSAYSGKVHVAFKYVGNNSDKTGTWRIDNAKFNYDPSDVVVPVKPAEFSNWGAEDWSDANTPVGFDKAENVTKESTVKHGGSFAIKHTASSKTKDVQVILPVTGGKTYKISYWYLDNDPNAKTRIWSALKNADGKYVDDAAIKAIFQSSTYSTDNANWQEFSTTVTLPTGVAKLLFEVRVNKDNAGGGSVYYDDFSVVEQ